MGRRISFPKIIIVFLLWAAFLDSGCNADQKWNLAGPRITDSGSPNQKYYLSEVIAGKGSSAVAVIEARSKRVVGIVDCHTSRNTDKEDFLVLVWDQQETLLALHDSHSKHSLPNVYRILPNKLQPLTINWKHVRSEALQKLDLDWENISSSGIIPVSFPNNNELAVRARFKFKDGTRQTDIVVSLAGAKTSRSNPLLDFLTKHIFPAWTIVIAFAFFALVGFAFGRASQSRRPYIFGALISLSVFVFWYYLRFQSFPAFSDMWPMSGTVAARLLETLNASGAIVGSHLFSIVFGQFVTWWKKSKRSKGGTAKTSVSNPQESERRKKKEAVSDLRNDLRSYASNYHGRVDQMAVITPQKRDELAEEFAERIARRVKRFIEQLNLEPSTLPVLVYEGFKSGKKRIQLEGPIAGITTILATALIPVTTTTGWWIFSQSVTVCLAGFIGGVLGLPVMGVGAIIGIAVGVIVGFIVAKFRERRRTPELRRELIATFDDFIAVTVAWAERAISL